MICYWRPSWRAPTLARAWKLSSCLFRMPIQPGPRVSKGGLRAVLEKDCSLIVSWALIKTSYFTKFCGTLLKVYITRQLPAMIISIEIWPATKIKGVAGLPGNVVLFRLKKEEYCAEILTFRLLCINNLILEGRLFEGDALSSKCRLHWF